MERNQPFPDSFYLTNNRRVAGGGVIPTGRYLDFPLRDAGGIDPQLLARRRPIPSYRPGPSPSSITSSSYMDSRRMENESMTLPIYSPSPVTPPHLRDLLTKPQSRQDWPRRREGSFNDVPPRPHIVPGPSRGLTGSIGEYSCTYVLEHQEQPTFGTPGSTFTPQSNWNVSTSTHNTQLHFNYAPTPGGGGHQNQFQAMNESVMPIPHSSYPGNPGSGTPSAADYTTSTWGGPLWEALRDPPDPYARARSRDRKPPLGDTPTSPDSSRARVDVPEYADPEYPHSLGHGGTGNEGHVVAVPPGPRSGRTFSQPTGIQRSRRGRKARQTAVQDKAGPGRNRTTKRKPDDFQVSTEQIPKTSVITRDPTYLVRVPQTRYECAARQDDWEGVSIEFGGIKLKDIADPAYTSLQDHDMEVLNYKGVGSTILCRITLSGRDIGRSKIQTTNNKNPPEAITKKKLGVEVAKLVKRYIESIKDETGNAEITFENLVLTRVVRVSKASFQPELWYEVTAPQPGPS